MSGLLDANQQHRYTGPMKVTVEIPDVLYRQVKVRAAQEGRTVRDVTVELYEQWLAAGGTQTDAERRAAADAWLKSWDELWQELDALPQADPRTTRQIIMDDRR